MKKLFLLSALFAVGLAVTSCSESLEEANGGSNKLTGEDEAFIALRINTPATSENAKARKTRAGETYTADNGDEKEYGVNDGIIVFFGESETTADVEKATVVSAYVLPGLTKSTDPKTEEVTTQYTSTLNVTEAGLGGYTHRYALVLLNSQNYFTVSDAKKLLIGGTEFTGTFPELMHKRIPVDKMGNGTEGANKSQTAVGSNGLLMTSAPLSSTNNGTAGTVQYLKPINDENIKPTEAQAKDNALSIHVERAAAKVQVSGSVTELESSKLGDGDTKVKIKELTWLPDNLAPTFNFVREVNANDLTTVKTDGTTYRYTGGTAVYDTGTPGLYRTTWAVDQLGYTEQLGENALTNLGGKTPDAGNFLASGKIAYIPENTMDYNWMYQRNTSRIIVKAKLWDGTNENVALYNTNVLDVNRLYTKTELETKLKTYADGLASAETPSSGSTFTYTITPNETTGKATLKVETTGSENLDAWNTALAKIDINYFKEGVCYYKLQIKHYHPGDDAADEVKKPVTSNGPAYDNVYVKESGDTDGKKQKANYLGLYGVVRNTWYVITISKINYAGTPTIPEVPKDTPDDEVNSYISARINVMQWAKRSQSAEL